MRTATLYAGLALVTTTAAWLFSGQIFGAFLAVVGLVD